MQEKLTIREEANAITCYSFRNSYLENLHAGNSSSLLKNDGLSRITDAEMKKLMIEASGRVARLIKLKEVDPDSYWELISRYTKGFTRNWVKNDVDLSLQEKEQLARDMVTDLYRDTN